jgi:hypothetical protein
MNGEGRIPPALIVALVIVTLAVGVAAYYMGRFGGSSRHAPAARVELPAPAAPAPAVGETVPTPAEIPPTVTPAIPVVVERSRGSSKVLVERSSQIVVSVPTELPTPLPAALPSDAAPPPRRRVVIEVRPTPTPTVPELELRAPPPPAETPEPPEPEPEETPEAVPTAGPRANAALSR